MDEGWIGGKIQRREELLGNLVLGDGREDRPALATAVARQGVAGRDPSQIGPGMPAAGEPGLQALGGAHWPDHESGGPPGHHQERIRMRLGVGVPITGGIVRGP